MIKTQLNEYKLDVIDNQKLRDAKENVEVSIYVPNKVIKFERIGLNLICKNNNYALHNFYLETNAAELQNFFKFLINAIGE